MSITVLAQWFLWTIAVFATIFVVVVFIVVVIVIVVVIMISIIVISIVIITTVISVISIVIVIMIVVIVVGDSRSGRGKDTNVKTHCKAIKITVSNIERIHERRGGRHQINVIPGRTRHQRAIVKDIGPVAAPNRGLRRIVADDESVVCLGWHNHGHDHKTGQEKETNQKEQT